MSVIAPLCTSEYILLKLSSISLNRPKYKARFSFGRVGQKSMKCLMSKALQQEEYSEDSTNNFELM